MNGKGDKQRPTSKKRFAENYDRIFNEQSKYVPVRKMEKAEFKSKPCKKGQLI